MQRRAASKAFVGAGVVPSLRKGTHKGRPYEVDRRRVQQKLWDTIAPRSAFRKSQHFHRRI